MTPLSMLPNEVKASLKDKEILDFGLNVEAENFDFYKKHCTVPSSLVVAYALAVATSGSAKRIYMAGFDGFGADDPRSHEMKTLLEQYQSHQHALDLISITPTRYGIHTESVYALSVYEFRGSIKMRSVVIIPARYASSRFPGKPLVSLLGKPMILWVAELAGMAVGNDNVYVATEDERIAKTVLAAGFQAVMTSDSALTGTDRLAEAAEQITAEVYINVQGDEPLVAPTDILKVRDEKLKYPNEIINGFSWVSDNEDPHSVNIPKLITNEKMN